VLKKKHLVLVLKKGKAGAATGNCRCLKREQLADSLRPTLHTGNGGGESWDRKLQVLKKGTAGAATGNCRCLKREQLADSLRPTLHTGNGGGEYWDRKLQVLKNGTAGAATGNCRCLKKETAGRQPGAYFTYRKWVWRILGQETAGA
jgi:hypothetical protein